MGVDDHSTLYLQSSSPAWSLSFVVDYRGGKTTLCAGCGHNAISERIIDAMYEMGVKPESVAKLSGIGCSSKSPAYCLNHAHGFNAVHGRMPSVATGAALEEIVGWTLRQNAASPAPPPEEPAAPAHRRRHRNPS